MSASEILVNVVFYVFAGAAIAGAAAVAASRNIVRSAFALLAVLFSAAAMYAVMKADFIAAAQVLIYVGGILVLIIFAVMLTHRITDVNVSNESTPGPAAFCACLCLLFSLVIVVLFTVKWERGPREIPVRAGGVEVGLLQYQADGKTGLARGGTAGEDRVVLALRAKARDLAPEAAEVVFQAKPVEGGPLATAAGTLGPEDGNGGRTARAELAGLGEKAYRWQAQVRVAGRELTASAAGEGPDFEVRRGVTRPVAVALMGPYLFAFEVASVLLLAALVGAAFLARKEVKE